MFTDISLSSMVTPRIVSLSEDFTTWLSIWSDNSSAGAFLEDFEPMAIVCYLLGLAFRRFTLYHRVTFSVSLFSSSAAFLLEIFAAFPRGRRFWRPLVCSLRSAIPERKERLLLVYWRCWPKPKIELNSVVLCGWFMAVHVSEKCLCWIIHVPVEFRGKTCLNLLRCRENFKQPQISEGKWGKGTK